MALSETRQGALLRYCRIDEPTAEDLTDLEAYYDAACSYMEQAGVREPAAGTPREAQWLLCVKYLVLDAWDRRELTMTGSAVENPTFRRVLNQLKLTEPLVSELDTIPPEEGTA